MFILLLLLCCTLALPSLAAAHTIAVKVNGDGSTDRDATNTVNDGANFTVTATANNACIKEITTKKYGDEPISISEAVGLKQYPYTFNAVNSDYAYEVTFGTAKIIVEPKLLKITPGPGGETTEPFNAPWKAYALSSDEVANTAKVLASGTGNGSFTIPNVDIPCDTQAIAIVFEPPTTGNYYAPSLKTVDLGNAFGSGETIVEGLYEANSYQVQVTVNPTGRGQVNFGAGGIRNTASTQSTGSDLYYFEKTTTLTAEELGNGYFFHKWTGSTLNSNNGFTSEQLKNKTLTIKNIDRDYDITAHFAKPCQDEDGDGYYTGLTAEATTTAGCTGLPADAPEEADCDDSNPSIHPGAQEICGDGIDQNCDGMDVACGEDEQDADGDGFAPSQGDCNDNNPNFAPSKYDEVDNVYDEDCYGGPKETGEEVKNVVISDTPANIRKKPAPPLIMFLLDDSGSMDYGFVIKGKTSISPFYNMFPRIPKTQGEYYTTSDGYKHNWPARWSGYNSIYFNPNASYLPWPMWKEVYSYNRTGVPERMGEKNYNPSKLSNPEFPHNAFQPGYTHADMDLPRYNSLNGSANYTGTSTKISDLPLKEDAMYHPGDYDPNRTAYEIDLNATFTLFVPSGGFQQYVTLRNYTSSSRSVADAIGLSTRGDLEGTSLKTPEQTERHPEYIFDDRSGAFSLIEGMGTEWTADYDSQYGWKQHFYRTVNTNSTGRWYITDVPDNDYYVYIWLPHYSDIYNNGAITGNSTQRSIYTINYSGNNAGTNIVYAIVDLNQRGKGGRWTRLGGPYRFVNKQDYVRIPLAHYYIVDDKNGDGQYTNGEDVYLVTIPGSGGGKTDYSLKFYKVTHSYKSGNDYTQGNATAYTPVAYENVPESIKPKRYYTHSACPTNSEDCRIKDPVELAYVMRQEFANWASFYSRRMLTAKAALGHTVADMKDVSLGIMGINKTKPNIPLTYIKDVEGTKKKELLRTIYNYRSKGSTPLREGLYTIGKYFQRGSGGDKTALITAVDPETEERCRQPGEPGKENASVFWSEECGGACQRAYVIVITDGYYNDLTSGYALSPTNVDGFSSTKYPKVLQDSRGSTMADYAMYFYDIDLDKDLPDNVESKLYDDNNRQHLTTFTVAFGVGGNYDYTWRYPDCLPSNATSCTTPGQSAACPRIENLIVHRHTQYTAGVSANSLAIFPGTCPEWWPNTTDHAKIDDLWHAAVNSRGEYLNAADPATLITSLATIKDLVTEQIGTAASVSVNTQKIETDSLLYQTTFLSGVWEGDVVAKCLNSEGQVVSCQLNSCLASCTEQYNAAVGLCTGTTAQACREAAAANRETCRQLCNVAEEGAEIQWKASEHIPEPATRQIITVDTNYNETGQVMGIPFTWEKLSPGMRISLTGLDPNNSSSGYTEDLPKYVVNYFRGDRSKEGELGYPITLRKRTGLLGDFINSEATHYKNKTLGIEWVIAGANDGMLHIFDANSGREEFAFIPSAVFNNLHYLLQQSYGEATHQYFVDGNVTIQQIGDTVVLVGGLSKGGKGWYALNLTAAAQAKDSKKYEDAAADIVLWEYHSAIYNPEQYGSSEEQLKYLGYSYSKPQIVTTKEGPVVVVGNGYNSEKLTSALLLLGLGENGKLIWTQTLDTGSGNDKEENGLSTPAILYPMGDGRNDFVYAGDLLGNIWKFDLSDSSRGQWKIFFEGEGKSQPLFIAKSLSGFRQPITMQPLIASSCASRQKGYMIYFGTGRLLGGDDFSDTSYQTIYGIWDWSAQWPDSKERYLGAFGGYASESAQSACKTTCADERFVCQENCSNTDFDCPEACEATRKSCAEICESSRVLSNASGVSLLRQTQIWGGGINYTETGEVYNMAYGVQPFEDFDNIERILTKRSIDWHKPGASSNDGKIRHVGWHYDLPLNGERVIVGMTLTNYRLIATSAVPSASPCDLEGGNSYYWSMDSCTGGQLDEAFFDANMDGVIDEKDYINIGTSTNPIYVPVSGIGVKGIAPAPSIVQVEGGPSRMYYVDESAVTNTRVPNIPDSPVNTGTNTVIFWSDRKW